MQKYIILILLICSFLIGEEADHIIFTQITITPDEAEAISIYNPTPVTISLSDYYLSDAENSPNSHYYNLPTGSDYWSGLSSDFIARFPDIDIIPGQTIMISLQNASSFNSYYSSDPDLALTDDMLDAIDGQNTIGSSANLSDPYEVLILFKWDGNPTSLIEDVDYFYWGNTQGLPFYGIDKTGISTYEDETPFNIQTNNILEAHDEDYSYVRKSITEDGENGPSNNITGNGITGHDETSEIFNQSWEIILNPALPDPIPGCIDETACNYDENATADDNSCEYPVDYYNCDVDCIIDSDEDGVCDELEIYGCTDPDAINYVEEADFDNGSCNLTANTIGEIIAENVGNECDENLSVNYSVIAMVIGYDDVTSSGGPEIIILQDDNGFQIDSVVWDWDVLSSNVGFMFDPYDPSEYIIYVTGTLGTYNCSWQFEIASASNILLYNVFHPQGDFQQDDSINKAEIKPAPYVVVPSIGERLDFEYSFPSNSRVIVRIFDMNYRFITSIVDKFYESAGTIERLVDNADWDGRNHLSQIVDPGTYLIHIEAINYVNGKSSTDIAPIVVGVNY